MESKDVKYLALIAFGVYLLFSYVNGSLNPFEVGKGFRFLQVCVFGILAWMYFQGRRYL